MGIGSWMSLWFGLSLPVIVILYLFKRIYIDTPVPSHMLWRRVLLNMEANRPWQKLQNRLLLWLQLLVAALLVFALMQPFLWRSGEHQGHTVLIADTSASMSAIVSPEASSGNSKNPGAGSKLDVMKQQLHTYVREAGAGEEISLIRLGSRPEVLLTRERDKASLSGAIDHLTLDYGSAAYRETLSLASALTREEEARVLLVTDTRWPEGAGAGTVAFDVPVQIMPIGAETQANAAIEQFGVKRSSGAEEGEEQEFKGTEGVQHGVAVIRNDGEARDLILDLYGDGKLLASRELTAEQGKRQTVQFSGLPSAEVYRLSLKPEDAYSLDNEAFAFREQAGAANVWLISSGNLFLEKALQLTGAKITRIAPIGASGGDGGTAPALPESKPDVVVIEGSLPSYTKSGAWAKLLAETPLWVIGEGEQGTALESADTQTVKHPVTRYLQLKEPPAGRLIKAEVPAWGNPILTVGGQTAAYAGTENGRPKLVFLFRLEDGDLPLKPEFPVLVDNAVAWLKSGLRTGLGRAAAGTELDIPVSQDAASAVWTAMDGYARKAGAQPVPAVTLNSGAISSSQQAPDIPGLWRLDVTGSDGAEQPGYLLEVIADPLESETTPTDQLAAKLQTGGQASSGAKQQDVDGSEGANGSQEPGINKEANGSLGNEHAASSPLTGADGEAVQRDAAPLVKWVALLALLVILAEWGVYQRGRSI
ncbi:vWA domain-containing protein [Paenibacillus sanguinis]|uniref:vWA domain-containing protein n=1 Tax=Paenibacillus sanguinis TaxID=225906 RepID=UPI000368A857|nr:VWA domain-containing protein [Paenibacillus sanguinis]